ncbi:MAG TPA: Pycsar system effector family protein [Rhizorhapis sp.]|nr:Pycsar system effector family protein [Rhizorhapis sp.]
MLFRVSGVRPMADVDIAEVQGAEEAAALSPNSVHLVRTAQLANLQLSQMADQKANMLMGATFLVFTLSMGEMKSSAFLGPFAILAFAAFFSALFAVLSVLPKVTHAHGPVGEDDNILFFGVFTSMGESEFVDRVIGRLKNDETLCRTMLRDLYQNGQVLQRKKYRFLGYAYRIFLTGLVLSFAVFVGELAAARIG